MRTLKNYWLECVIIVILLILIYCPNVLGLNTDSINNAILAITATVVLWYTHETKRMRIESAKQNWLQTRPILTMELRNQKAFVRNQGRGPALNSCVNYFSDHSAVHAEAMYDFHLPIFIALDSEHELIMLKKNVGTISEPDIFFEKGKTTHITIQYEDIERTRYETSLEIRAGIVQKISIVKQGFSLDRSRN